MGKEETNICEEGEGAAEAQPITDYEKQRLLRIRENEARLQDLGLRYLAASPLLRPPLAAAKSRQKKRPADADEEYLPPNFGSEEEEESSSASGEDDDKDAQSKSSSKCHEKGKKTPSNTVKTSKKSCIKENASVADFVDDDAALQQAIALSLVGSLEDSVTVTVAESSSTRMKVSECNPQKNNRAASARDLAKNRKIKKLGKSKIQLTEDDVVAFFFSLDEVGKGYITPWDLERMATIHDFIWTDFEISKMICCFDSDGDGKLNLEDFRAIVSRCNMLQESGT